MDELGRTAWPMATQAVCQMAPNPRARRACMYAGGLAGEYMYPRMKKRRLNTPSYKRPLNMTSYRSANKGGSFNQNGKTTRRRKRRTMRRGRKYRKYRRMPSSYRRAVNKMMLRKDLLEATNTYRALSGTQISCEPNECTYSTLTFLERDTIRDALSKSVSRDIDVANTRLADIAIDRTNITDVTQTYNVDTWIVNASRIVTIRNNGDTPCVLEAYWFHQKKALISTVNIYTQLQAALVAKGATSGTCMTDPRYNVRDGGSIFNRYFKLFKYRTWLLNAGDQVIVASHRRKPFIFDRVSPNEDQLAPFTQHVLLRMVGVVSHDETNTSNVGTCNATLDFIDHYHIKFNVENDQGFKKFIEEGTYDAQTIPVVDADPTQEVKETL